MIGIKNCYLKRFSQSLSVWSVSHIISLQIKKEIDIQAQISGELRIIFNMNKQTKSNRTGSFISDSTLLCTLYLQIKNYYEVILGLCTFSDDFFSANRMGNQGSVFVRS